MTKGICVDCGNPTTNEEPPTCDGCRAFNREVVQRMIESDPWVDTRDHQER